MIGLALASLAELLILRTFTRTAIHIPALHVLAGPYEVLSAAGRFAYYVAAVLLIVAIPFLVVSLWNRRFLASRVAAIALGEFAVTAALARAGLLDDFVLDVLAVAAVLVVAAAAPWAVPRRPAAVIVAFAMAFALTSGHPIVQGARQEGIGSWEGRPFLLLGEYAAVAFALSTPFILKVAPTRRARIAAVAVGVLTFMFFLGNGATTRILLLWNEGLSGSLPSVAYAVAGGALFASVAALLGQRRPVAAIGLSLLVIGGFGLHSTYQTGLVITGLAAMFVASGPRQFAAPAVARVRPITQGEPREYRDRAASRGTS
jgi:hypothetical protein